jgi:Tfp pilus assembly protein PilO
MMRIVGPFLFFAISVGLFFSAIRPGWEVLQALNEQEERVDEVLVESNRLRDTYEQLYNQRVAFSEGNVERLHVMVPENLDPIRFVMQMDRVAERYNIAVDNFTVPGNASRRIASQAYVTPQTFRFSVSGSYTSLKNFLRDIESSLVVMDVRSLSLTPVEKNEEDQGTVTDIAMTFSIDTYTFNPIEL